MGLDSDFGNQETAIRKGLSEETPRESRSQNGARKPAREELGSKNGMWKAPEMRPGWGISGQKAGQCSGRGGWGQARDPSHEATSSWEGLAFSSRHGKLLEALNGE